MSHTKWAMLRKLNDGQALTTSGPEMIAYAQGYILALEDALSDAKAELLWCEQVHADPEPLGRLIERIIDSLNSARRTLEALTK